MKLLRRLATFVTAIALILLLIPTGVSATASSFTVIFDANGGTGTMGSEDFTFSDTTKKLNANTFTRSGYQFTGWNTAKDGSMVSVADGAVIKDLTDKVEVSSTVPVTLYAQWKEKAAPASTPAPTVTNEEVKEDTWCITYLDCNGNTVSVQWVKTGGAPTKPEGYNYPDVSNVSSHQDIRPISCDASSGKTTYKVPNTADKG